MYLVRNIHSAIRPRKPNGAENWNSSRISVPVPSGKNSCEWFIEAKAPLIISSPKAWGRSNDVTLTVSRCLTPRCLASQVTVSPISMRPEVLPLIARSFVPPVLAMWASMLRARSKTRSRGASILVSSRMSGIFCEVNVERRGGLHARSMCRLVTHPFVRW